jgi:hypothetical protein
MRLRKLTLRFFLSILILTIGGGGLYYQQHPNVANCFLVGVSDFDQEGPDLYVSPDTPLETRNLLWEVIDQARDRVSDFWGSWPKNPIIIYCHNSEDFARYGSGTPGVAYLNPFQAFVVIGPEGLRTDIMSHELCHVELFERIGWFASEFEKPAWFDEGLALMLDYRYARREQQARHFGFLVDWDRNLKNGAPYLDLNELQSLEDFSSGDLRRKVFAYITSGKEVSRWLEIVGPAGLQELTLQLSRGGDFEQLYEEVENTHRRAQRRYTENGYSAP